MKRQLIFLDRPKKPLNKFDYEIAWANTLNIDDVIEEKRKTRIMIFPWETFCLMENYFNQMEKV